MREDVLIRLDRILDATPEHAYSTPPLPRQLIAQAAAEIRLLRTRLVASRVSTDSAAQERKQAD